MSKNLTTTLVALLLLGVSAGVSAEVKTFECKETHSWDKEDNTYLRLDDRLQYVRIDLERSVWIITDDYELPLFSTGPTYFTFVEVNDDGDMFKWSINKLTRQYIAETPVTYTEHSCKPVNPVF